MVYGSFFNVGSSVEQLQMRISLFRKGLDFTPNFGDYYKGDELNTLSNVKLDEIDVKWQEKSQRQVDENSENRVEMRLYTLVDGELPPWEVRDGNGKPWSPGFGFLKKWFSTNPIVDLPVKNSAQNVMTKASMLIMADLGDLSRPSAQDQVLVCRLTLFNQNLLVFDPPMTKEGFVLQSKFGEFYAKIDVLDESFDSIPEQRQRFDVTLLPDMSSFDICQEGFQNVSYNINLESCQDFDFDGIFIDWKLLKNERIIIKEGSLNGRTSKCFKKNGVFKMANTFSVNVSIPSIIVHEVNVRLRLQIISQDYWGRQWTAGIAVIQLPKTPGLTRETIECWRPYSSDPRELLKDFFIGNTMHIDYDTICENQLPSQLGLEMESTGSVTYSVQTIMQSRQFMTKDTLNHIRYGDLLGKMGVKSDIYWRIMKVLMEFEEARRELLRVRNFQKKRF